MSEVIEFVRYAFDARVPLNARTSRRVYEGALVRYNHGHGCLHPWPELGDGSLEEELQALLTGNETRLTRATHQCMSLDGEARQRGEWLFDGLQPPPSHATLPVPELRLVERAVEQGFPMVKVKGSLERLDQITQLLKTSPVPVRLDFNEALTGDALRRWNDGLSDHARSMIDFVEDPCPYDPIDWEARMAGIRSWC